MLAQNAQKKKIREKNKTKGKPSPLSISFLKPFARHLYFDFITCFS